MNLRDLANETAKRRKTHQIETYYIICTFMKVIVEKLLEGHIIKLRFLGSLFLDVEKERKYYNVKEKKVLIIPKRFGLKYKISKGLKKRIHAKKAY
jgi:nucleoid DNA-binding protein